MNEDPKRMTRSKKIFWAVVTVLGAAVALVIAGIGALFLWLPTPGEISSKLSSAATVESPNVGTAVLNTTQSGEPATDVPLEQTTSARTGTSSIFLHKSMSDEEIRAALKKPALQILYKIRVEEMFRQDPSDIHVCDSLGKVEMSTAQLNEPRAFYDMTGNREADQLNESFYSSVVLAFHDPDILAIYELANGYRARTVGLSEVERNSFLNKVGFYKDVMAHLAALAARTKDLEALGAQSSTLMDLARLTALRPRLGVEAEVLRLCNEAQDAAKSGAHSDPVAMKARVDAILQREKISRAELGELNILEARGSSKKTAGR